MIERGGKISRVEASVEFWGHVVLTASLGRS